MSNRRALGFGLGLVTLAACEVTYIDVGSNLRGAPGTTSSTAASGTTGTSSTAASGTTSTSGSGGAGTSGTTSTSGSGGTGGTGTGGAGTGGAPCIAGSSPGSTVWSRGYGGPGGQQANAVAVDAGGNLIMVGSFDSSIDFGCGLLTSTLAESFFVTKLDPGGMCLWSQSFSSDSRVGVRNVAVDPSGNVVLAGDVTGSIAFGGDTLTSGTIDSIFVVKLSPSGALLWSELIGNDATGGTGMAVDAAGNVFMTGNLYGSIPFGGSTLDAGGFVFKLDPSGAPVWGKSLGAIVQGNSVAVDPSGNVLVTGSFGPSVDFGCGAPLTNTSEMSAFVAKLDPMLGACVWNKAFVGTNASGTSIAADASANVLVTGSVASTLIDFGDGSVSCLGASLFVASLGPNGTLGWGRAFGIGEGETSAVGLAADADGAVFVTGYFGGYVDFGNGALTSAGVDVFIASFSAAGTTRWAERFGDPQIQQALGIAVDPSSDHVAIVGTFQGTLDFGCAPVASAGDFDVFVAELVR